MSPPPHCLRFFLHVALMRWSLFFQLGVGTLRNGATTCMIHHHFTTPNDQTMQYSSNCYWTAFYKFYQIFSTERLAAVRTALICCWQGWFHSAVSLDVVRAFIKAEKRLQHLQLLSTVDSRRSLIAARSLIPASILISQHWILMAEFWILIYPAVL